MKPTQWTLLLSLIYIMILTLTTQADDYISPAGMTLDANTLYIADKTGRQILEYATDTRQITCVFPLPASPLGITAQSESGLVYITAGVSSGAVFVLDPSQGITHIIPVGHTPMSPVLNNQNLFVCNRFDNSISCIDLSLNQEIARIAVGREPIALALTPDETRLVVVHHLPEGPSDDNYSSITVSIINTATRSIINTIPLYDGASGGRGVCVSPDGIYAYITHLIGRYKMPTNQLERGWMWNNAVSIIKIANGTKVNTVLLDDVYAGAANPWAIACSSEGNYLCVTHSGSMEVSVIDRPALHQRLDSVAAGAAVPCGFSSSADDVPGDLGFLAGLRKRVQLTGNGPRSLALAGNSVWVGNYFSESLDTFDLTEAYPRSEKLLLGQPQQPSLARLGEQYFNDGNTCYQKWLSCASCHPDGRMDGLNWDLMNDGMGSPRNVKSLLLAHYSAPAMITGIRANAEVAINAGFKFIQFMSIPVEKEAAVNAWLRSERPVPSPHLVRGNYSLSAQRGRNIFYGKAHCGFCHQGDLYIDPSANDDYISEIKYDVGTNRPDDTRPLDVPTLAEAWRTAPYLQNGGAATIMEVLTTHNPNNRHGITSGLNQAELQDLQEFVLSIGKALYTSDSINGDITGLLGEADGIVDIQDFLALLSDWIQGNSFLTASPTDINGQYGIKDYQVDMFDMMDVSSRWLFSYNP